jgi:DNA (cytosine-5)-methyltransferase 1
MRDLAKDGRAPKIVTVENVYGAITANDGQDFQAIASAFSGADYRFGAMIIDARHFVPQSRPRFFMIGVRGDLEIPDKLISKTPIPLWHPQRLVNVAANLSERAMRRWVWWALQKPPSIRTSLADILEDSPTSVEWHTVAETKRLLGMMTPLNRAKVTEAMRQGTCEVGAVYKRVRTDTSGNKQQRAEARFDNIAGCLRTPRGGSSRQTLLVIEGSHVRSRLLSSREAARLMGLPDNYRLPSRYNDAYQLAGDGVVVPVVAHLRKYLFESVLDVNTIPSRMAV